MHPTQIPINSGVAQPLINWFIPMVELLSGQSIENLEIIILIKRREKMGYVKIICGL